MVSEEGKGGAMNIGQRAKKVILRLMSMKFKTVWDLEETWRHRGNFPPPPIKYPPIKYVIPK